MWIIHVRFLNADLWWNPNAEPKYKISDKSYPYILKVPDNQPQNRLSKHLLFDPWDTSNFIFTLEDVAGKNFYNGRVIVERIEWCDVLPDQYKGCNTVYLKSSTVEKERTISTSQVDLTQASESWIFNFKNSWSLSLKNCQVSGEWIEPNRDVCSKANKNSNEEEYIFTLKVRFLTPLYHKANETPKYTYIISRNPYYFLYVGKCVGSAIHYTEYNKKWQYCWNIETTDGNTYRNSKVLVESVQFISDKALQASIGKSFEDLKVIKTFSNGELISNDKIDFSSVVNWDNRLIECVNKDGIKPKYFDSDDCKPITAAESLGKIAAAAEKASDSIKHIGDSICSMSYGIDYLNNNVSSTGGNEYLNLWYGHDLYQMPVLNTFSTVTTGPSNINSTATINTGTAWTWNNEAKRIESLEDTIKNLEKEINKNKKENTKMKNFKDLFHFGPVNSTKLSTYGPAFLNQDTGDYLSYDEKTSTWINVNSFVFDAPSIFYAMPAAKTDVKVGDFILTNGSWSRVCSIDEADHVKVENPWTKTIVELLPETSIFGFNFYTKLVNLVGNLFGTPSAENPFGNPLMLMLMTEGKTNFKDMLPLFLLSQNGTADLTSNPLFLMMMLDK